jgi:hypothetical protein
MLRFAPLCSLTGVVTAPTLEEREKDMQGKIYRLVGAAIFCAATLICPLNAFAPEKGQDRPDEKCQRNNKNGSTTTGQCSSVCKDLDVGGKDVNSGYRTCKEA